MYVRPFTVNNSAAPTLMEIDNIDLAQQFLMFVHYFAKICKSLGRNTMVISNNRVYSVMSSIPDSGSFLGNIDMILNYSNLKTRATSKPMAKIRDFLFGFAYQTLLVNSHYIIEVEKFLSMYKEQEKAKTLKNISSIAFGKHCSGTNGLTNLARYTSFAFFIGDTPVFTTSSDLVVTSPFPRVVSDPADAFVNSCCYNPNTRYSQDASIGVVSRLIFPVEQIASIFNAEAPTDIEVQTVHDVNGKICLSKNIIPKAFIADEGDVSIHIYNTPSKGLYILAIRAVRDGVLMVVDAKTVIVE